MPFLCPALTALVSDAIILFLGHQKPNGKSPVYDDEDKNTWVYKVQYLGYIAVARIILLLLPLLFHSYTGTALRCSAFYWILYWSTLVVVLAQSLCLSLVNPESLEAFWPIDTATSSSIFDINSLHELRRIWWVLTLSLVSDCCHLIILINVRSTAPQHDPLLLSSGYDKQQMRQPSIYFALRSNHRPGGPGTPAENYDGEEHQHEALMHAMGDFLDDIHLRLQRTKIAWAARVEDFSRRLTSHADNNNRLSSSKSSSSNQAPMSITNPLNPLTPFRVLLQLFADEDVVENGRLDAVFALDDGASMTFFVPQLLSFLLHGALYKSQNLEEWILDKCSRNVYFAHRCYWFLRAWCLEVPAEPISRQNSESRLSQMINSGSNRGGSAATAATGGGLSPFLDEPATPQSIIPCKPPRPGSDRFSTHSASGRRTGTPTLLMNEKLLPEERFLIERLMLRVKECGESAAETLAYGSSSGGMPHHHQAHSLNTNLTTIVNGAHTSAAVLNTTSTGPMNGIGGNNYYSSSTAAVSPSDICSSPSELMMAAESGAIPIDPSTGLPSLKHLDCVSAKRRYGFLPINKNSNNNGQRGGGSLKLNHNNPAKDDHNHSITPGETEQFDKTPQFLDTLIYLADSLFHVPAQNRKAELREQLREMECEFLPANAVYMPIRNVHHRVWRIVAEESIPIGTKERVPCFVCLEVVDFAPVNSKPKSQRHHHAWGFLDRLPRREQQQQQQQRSTSTESIESTTVPTGTPPLSPTVPIPSPTQPAVRRTTLEGIELSDLSDTESEIISKWRYERRDPLRRTSLFDKVTLSSVVDSMKTPLDKMNRAFRDQNHATVNEELRALVLGEEIIDRIMPSSPPAIGTSHSAAAAAAVAASSAENGTSSTVASTTTITATRIIDGIPMGATANTNAEGQEQAGGGRMSRVSSGGSLLSMGQWMTPEPAADDESGGIHKPRLPPDDNSVRRRLSGTSDSPSLPYGSDHEGDFSSSSLMLMAETISPTNKTALGVKETIDGGTGRGSKSSTSTTRRRPPVVFRESWESKQERLRSKSAFGKNPGWRLLTIMIKANDDLRQEQLACQLIYRMAAILAREKIPVWLCPYEIIALTDSGGIVEAIPDTISIDSLKRNDPNFRGLKCFFLSHFGHTPADFADAQANFVESLAAYSIVCFLLQLKDRHNGNILIDNKGHIIHIDFGFFFLSSPGKNAGFESAPFKLTRDFVEVLGGPNSRLFRTYRELCVKTFLTLRKHCMEIILMVEMLKTGNEELNCFRGQPDRAISELRRRFRLDLNDRACREYVNALVDDSIENWRTDWYDRYQRYCVGVL